jgi:ribosome-associated protein
MSETNDFSERPSKSQRKREMTALQKLGETLVNLPQAQLELIPLESKLRAEIDHARTIKDHEGKRRQLQYIGKLMRHVDAEPIEAALAKIQIKHQQNTARFHLVEQWRDQLIAQGDTQLESFVSQFSQADRQHLRQLVRNAQQGKRGAEKELFRYIQEIICSG